MPRTSGKVPTFTRLAVYRFRIWGRDQRDLLLDGVEPLAHPVHVLDEEVVPRSSTEGKSDQ